MKSAPPGRYMSIGLTYAVLAVVLGLIVDAVIGPGAGILVAVLFGAVALFNLAIGAVGLGVKSARDEDHAG